MEENKIITVVISEILSKEVTISVPANYTEEDVEEAVRTQVYIPSETLKKLKTIPKVVNDEGEGWESDNLTIMEL